MWARGLAVLAALSLAVAGGCGDDSTGSGSPGTERGGASGEGGTAGGDGGVPSGQGGASSGRDGMAGGDGGVPSGQGGTSSGRGGTAGDGGAAAEGGAGPDPGTRCAARRAEGAGGQGGDPGADAVECTGEVYEGDVRLEDEADVQALAGFGEVNGSLWIGGTVRNLAGLGCLKEVNGDIVIEDAAELRDIDGLVGLVAVSGTVSISGEQCANCVGAPALRDLCGFENLAVIGGDLFYSQYCGEDDTSPCRNRPVLEHLDGFDSLVAVGASVMISDTDTLLDINGFNRLVSVGGDITLRNNTALGRIGGFQALEYTHRDFIVYVSPVLARVDGLRALARVNGRFGLDAGLLPNVDDLDNLTVVGSLGLSGPELANIDAFDDLETLGGSFSIENTALENLDPLERGVFTVTNGLSIRNNRALRNLRGLSDLGFVSSSFVITDNPVLPQCEATWLRDRVDTSNTYQVLISGNDNAGVCL